ncbi:dipeptide ABC transporter ATP-binding protein [Solwaraspora sp. WMMD1047]|uniref:dipeptide ABC transporter ATP-binding protein n=1 Tax=Solwaraspora sp. WMMD1047 TaxID=3016102 RepID=UPI0024178420|nr:dipeptide ABC transporter ATP-binding protein [Solwaraspora sp. WMMD1047]MDG4831005.1 dipeptide ABC transporter ATP-binding protein [Solwaraspora sp. WMMD1047]
MTAATGPAASDRAASGPGVSAGPGRPLLAIEDLSVVIDRPGRRVAALSGVDLRVDAGEVVGLVGESGGGKSMVARSIVGLLPAGSHATGRVLFAADSPAPHPGTGGEPARRSAADGTTTSRRPPTQPMAGEPPSGEWPSGGPASGGQPSPMPGMADVLRMDAAALRAHRGHGAAICFQNPRGALSPTRTVGRQLTDRLITHQSMSPRRARESARELFEAVGIRNPGRRLDAYPHELSGGMAQRVMISLATGCGPGLLIADEPTTGLDVTLAREILRQFRHAADADRRGVLLISHDLASIAEICDRVVVLYAGTVVESGPTARVLREPAHPYTRALLASVPDVDGRPVTATAGAMPLLREPPDACPFAPRCPHATAECTTARPPTVPAPTAAGTGAGTWTVACVLPQTGPPVPSPTMPGPAAPPDLTALPATAADPGTTRTVLEIDDAHVVYRSRFGRGGHRALRGVSLRVAAGETLGVVGESGCGKSTLARLILGLVPAERGTVTVGGARMGELRGRELRRLRSRAQLVFQDPVGSLSPRRTVADAIAEPLRALGVPAAERADRVGAVLDRMELDRSILTRRPHELSGGQAQRVGIARALVGEPDLIVFDEPTSALDVTVQAQILRVIGEVAADRSRGSVFISHDLATVRGFADRVVVLYLGRIVEEGPVDEVFARPRHPYTRALLSSAPSLGAGFAGRRVELVKDLEEADAAAGCPLAARCPFVTDRCRTEEQHLRPYDGSRAACWRSPEIPALLGEDPDPAGPTPASPEPAPAGDDTKGGMRDA